MCFTHRFQPVTSKVGNHMEPPKIDLEPSTISINGEAAIAIQEVRLVDRRPFGILLPGRAGIYDLYNSDGEKKDVKILFLERAIIHLYAFHSFMFPIETKREGTECYQFSGPNLGLYYDIADIREGPYIKHYIEQLEISISYPSRVEALFVIKGRCDLSKSYFDSYWYKGPKSGKWSFKAQFAHKFP